VKTVRSCYKSNEHQNKPVTAGGGGGGPRPPPCGWRLVWHAVIDTTIKNNISPENSYYDQCTVMQCSATGVQQHADVPPQGSRCAANLYNKLCICIL
jgi:hypothetical protein